MVELIKQPDMRANYDRVIAGIRTDTYDVVTDSYNVVSAGKSVVGAPIRHFIADGNNIENFTFTDCIVCGKFEIRNTHGNSLVMDGMKIAGGASIFQSGFNFVEMVNTICTGTCYVLSDVEDITIDRSSFQNLRLVNGSKSEKTRLHMRCFIGTGSIEGHFSDISLTHSNLSSVRLNCTGKITDARGTFGDGKYVKTIVYKDALYTYTHDKLWVTYKNEISVEEIQISDLANGDVLPNHPHYANIVDMILDDPAKPLPEKRTDDDR